MRHYTLKRTIVRGDEKKGDESAGPNAGPTDLEAGSAGQPPQQDDNDEKERPGTSDTTRKEQV
jgi:hypothetical protein